MKDTSATVLGLIPRAEPVRVEGRQKATGGHTKVSKGTRGHKGKLHLFERSSARWAGRVALQPHLEAFLMVTFNKVRSSFVWKGPIYSRMATFWSQSPRLLFLELH